MNVRVLALCAVLASASADQGETLDTAKIEEITGLKGSRDEAEGVFKVTSPRTDVKVIVDGTPLPPFMGLTSWAAFQRGKSAPAMVMGDLVLFQDEVNPVMSTLLDSGISVTALHNHFFFDEPKVFFMHIDGEGKADALATGVRRAFDKVKEIRAAEAKPASRFGPKPAPEKSAISAPALEQILGVHGQSKDGMFKAVIGRSTHAACGCELGREMGVNTWAGFAGEDGDAIVDGDFAVLEAELQPVLRALRKADIDIVAIHHHMTGETPRVLFLHYWGRGQAAALARGLKSALDVQAK
jgi:hypothetical protein